MQINEEQELTIESFFKMCENEGGQYQIDTPDGWQDINFLVKHENKECYKLVTESGLELGCSNEHLILTTNDWKKSHDIENDDVVVTKNGIDTVAKKIYIGIRNTFDLQVNSKQNRYYTNNIVSHNCGKSRICEALASEWQLNLIQFDPARVYSSRVGDSEGNMYMALARIESMAPCVLFIDEIEKGFAGIHSSSFSDAGTTARTIGIFLIWMNDNDASVFTVATCNQIHVLPPELVSRFDEIFYVGPPDVSERKEIIAIQIRENGRDPAKFDLDKLAQACQYLSGREIMQSTRESIYRAFALKKQGKVSDLTTDILLSTLQKKIPIVKTMEQQLQNLVKWVGYDKERKDGIRARFANNEMDEIDALFEEILSKPSTGNQQCSSTGSPAEDSPTF
ncbi:MAG: AAA family ATPase [Nitrosarchaeum sp.]|nr:AAA family ATPase [Nitrosarchaeum sp.]